MRYQALTAIGLCLAATQLAAQSAPPPADRPVQQTQAPEDKATAPLPDPAGPLPPPAPAATPAATAPAKKPPAWDVNRPTGLRTREVPIRVDEAAG